MPRRHRSARARTPPTESVLTPVGVAPEWAQAPRFSVRAVSGAGTKTYRCPGCQQEIRPGTPHLVVVAEDDVEGRRHWHTPCWRTELRRVGRGV